MLLCRSSDLEFLVLHDAYGKFAAKTENNYCFRYIYRNSGIGNAYMGMVLSYTDNCNHWWDLMSVRLVIPEEHKP